MKKNTFKTSEKLRKNREIHPILKSGIKLAGEFILVLYLPGETRKIAFTVSKKVSKKASTRNRIKRRLRELYRTNKALLPERIRLVVIARGGADSVSFENMENEIKILFSKINS